MIFEREPVVWVNLIKAFLTLLIAFGVSLTETQEAAIMGFVGVAVIIIAGGLVSRSLVTPVSNPRLEEGTEIEVTHDGRVEELRQL
jgi:hypothetical protein